jgi:hypothetical protein
MFRLYKLFKLSHSLKLVIYMVFGILSTYLCDPFLWKHTVSLLTFRGLLRYGDLDLDLDP